MWKCSCGQKNFPPQEEKLYFSLPFTHEKKQNISTFSRNSRKNLSLGFTRGKKNFWNFSRFSVLLEIFCRESVFHSVSNTELFFPPGFPFLSWKDVVCNDKVKQNNNNSVKMFLEKGKKKISCVKLDASLFPRFIFLLKFIFHKWINTKVQCLKELEKISHRMTKTFSPTLFHSRRKKNFPLKK